MNAAVKHFNETCGYHLDPSARHTFRDIARMAEVARLRGHGETADKLELAVERLVPGHPARHSNILEDMR
jgi:hypothetical protein